MIRDERDYEQHVNYIHYNPVKHGYVAKAAEWEHSSIHRYINRGIIDKNWGCADFSQGHDFGERT
jgi:putative transposase